MAACLLATQHSFVVAQMEIWSTHATCFPDCNPVPDVLSKDGSAKKPASGRKSGDKSEEVTGEIRVKLIQGINNKPVKLKPYHCFEEMPVPKIHVHLLLQLVQVTLAQDTTVHICLGMWTYTALNFTWLWSYSAWSYPIIWTCVVFRKGRGELVFGAC